MKTFKAITYITSTAVEELTIMQWLLILNGVYKDGIPEEAKFGDAINWFVERFPGFEQRAQDNTQESYDRLYEDFMTWTFNQIKNGDNGKDSKEEK